MRCARKIGLLIVVAILLFLQVGAQSFSYIYIQGDKETPFYVKLDGQMMPRYGKNYCILSELTGGRKNIEVLFQQRAFPSQKFTIDVPENGYRGLMLVRKDGAFVLYDLLQKKYLAPGGDQ